MHAHTCAHTRKVRMHNTCTHTHTLVRTHMHTHPAAICTAWLLARWPCRQRLLLREAVLSALPDAGRHDPAAPTRSGLFGGGWKRAVSGGAWGARSPAEGVDTRWWPGALRRGELTPHLTAVLLLDPGKPPTSRPAGWGGLCLPLALPHLGAPAPTEWAKPGAKARHGRRGGQSGSRFQKHRRRLCRRGATAARPLCWVARAPGWGRQGASPVIRAPGTVQGPGFLFYI